MLEARRYSIPRLLISTHAPRSTNGRVLEPVTQPGTRQVDKLGGQEDSQTEQALQETAFLKTRRSRQPGNLNVGCSTKVQQPGHAPTRARGNTAAKGNGRSFGDPSPPSHVAPTRSAHEKTRQQNDFTPPTRYRVSTPTDTKCAPTKERKGKARLAHHARRQR